MPAPNDAAERMAAILAVCLLGVGACTLLAPSDAELMGTREGAGHVDDAGDAAAGSGDAAATNDGGLDATGPSEGGVDGAAEADANDGGAGDSAACVACRSILQTCPASPGFDCRCVLGAMSCTTGSCGGTAEAYDVTCDSKRCFVLPSMKLECSFGSDTCDCP
jgi:hypothetical protein